MPLHEHHNHGDTDSVPGYGSEVADDLAKGKIDSVWGFKGHDSRRMVAPEALLDWIRHPTKDDMGLGCRILDELKAIVVRGIVDPYRPLFIDQTSMEA